MYFYTSKRNLTFYTECSGPQPICGNVLTLERHFNSVIGTATYTPYVNMYRMNHTVWYTPFRWRIAKMIQNLTKRAYMTLTTGDDFILMIILHLIRSMLSIKWWWNMVRWVPIWKEVLRVKLTGKRPNGTPLAPNVTKKSNVNLHTILQA